MSRPTDLVIPLFGLRCGSCALRTRRKFEALSGVVHASVSVVRERAVVSYFPEHTDRSEIMSVVEAAGFDSRVKRSRLTLVDPRFSLTNPRALRESLCGQEGVVATSVDVTSEEVIVDYVPEETAPDKIARLATAAGFEMRPVLEGARKSESWAAITIVSFLFALAGSILSLKVGSLDWPQSIIGALRSWLAEAIPQLNAFPASSLDAVTVILAVLTLAIGGRSMVVNAWRGVTKRRVEGTLLTSVAMIALIVLATVRLVLHLPSFGLATSAMWLLAIFHGGKLLQGRLKRPRTAESEPFECGHPLSKIEQRAEKISAAVAVLTLLAGIAAAAVWLFVAGTSHTLTAVVVFATVLVAVSPTSVYLGVAAVLTATMEKAATRGVRFLSGRSIERLHDVSDIVLLESALPSTLMVTEFVLVEGTSVDDLLRYAMTVGAESNIAGMEAILARCGTMTPPAVRRVERHEPGVAVAILDGTKVTVGKASAIRALQIDTRAIDDEIAFYSSMGKAPVVVALDARILGAIVVGREITQDACDAVHKLRSRGHAVWLATREEPEVARSLSRLLDLDGVMSQPDRGKWWQELRGVGRKDGRITIVGDAAHDEDLLVKADRSIAVGKSESGADARVAGGISGVAGALDLADAAIRRGASNLRYAILYDVAAAAIAAGSLVPLVHLVPSPPLAAACMVIATLAIEWRGTRMRR